MLCRPWPASLRTSIDAHCRSTHPREVRRGVRDHVPQTIAAHDTCAAVLSFQVSKDKFTMDYRYPLSAVQAFTICLASFDRKMACE